MTDWPTGLQPYKRTPEFTETSIPLGLLRAHATKAGTWAQLHVLEGRLRFRELVRDRVFDLGPGIHPVIRPEEQHEVAPLGPVRFFVEFCRMEGEAGKTL